MNRLQGASESLARQLKRILAQVEADAHLVVAKLAVDLTNEIVERCPRDTGRARASIQLDSHDTSYNPPPGQYADPQPLDPGDVLPSEQYVIYSNLEYMPKLEDGSSRQAPGGFWAVTVAGAARAFRIAADKFDRKRYS